MQDMDTRVANLETKFNTHMNKSHLIPTLRTNQAKEESFAERHGVTVGIAALQVVLLLVLIIQQATQH